MAGVPGKLKRSAQRISFCVDHIETTIILHGFLDDGYPPEDLGDDETEDDR